MLPAQRAQHFVHRQPHYGVARTVDRGDKAASGILDTVGPGLVEGVAAFDIGLDFLRRERAKGYAAGCHRAFDHDARARQRERGYDDVSISRQQPQHPPRVVRVHRFLQDLSAAFDHRVGAKHQRLRAALRNADRLVARHAQSELPRALVRPADFVDAALDHLEFNSRGGEQALAPGRTGGEDQFRLVHLACKLGVDDLLPERAASRKGLLRGWGMDVADHKRNAQVGAPRMARRFRHVARWRAAALVPAAAILASIALIPRVNAAGASGRFTLAQLLPFERNKVEPLDLHKAFVEGYEAYRRRDYFETVERMQLAAKTLPGLADYALYYLGQAERASSNSADAAQAFRQLMLDYPQSVLADAGALEYARLELDSGRPDLALAAAAEVAAHTNVAASAQNARMLIARARFAAADFRAAYDEAQRLRDQFPGGADDAEARTLAYRIVSDHPGIVDTSSLRYRMAEASVLLREGQPSLALAQVRSALAMGPPPAARAELIWLEAQASRADIGKGRAALGRYLALAPAGPHAPAALNALAHSYWRADDTAQARVYFGRIVHRFRTGAAAPRALFELGRTYEDDGAFESARGDYLSVIKRYPTSEAAADARFRAPFMLYMIGQYDLAAQEFSRGRARTHDTSDRDMFGYWEGRALERAGDSAGARAVLSLVAASIDSNYYPAIAAMRVGAAPPAFPAAIAPEIVAVSAPAVQSGSAQFHLQRVSALREMGLRELEPAELRALETHAGNVPALRNFVLAELTDVGAWYDALQMAQRMVKRNELDPLIAERLRYPRGFWDLITGAAGRNELDPLLVAALIRQESLFNPQARSVSDARGLMQLLPSTAERYASAAGVMPSPLDLYDPGVSVQIGTTYLRQLMVMFNGDVFKAVAAYNGGEHAVAGWMAKYPGDDDQFVENIGFHETRDYVKKVIGGQREYRLLYQPRASTAANRTASNSQG